MTIWIVGISDVESNEIKHICKTEELAIKRLFEERDKLVINWEYMIKHKEFRGDAEMYNEMIKNLMSDDYEHWNNYPHEVPYIEKREVEE